MECQKTYTPEFSDKEPCELISSKCVLYENAIAYLGIQPNSSIEDVIKSLLFSLIDARNRINKLENPEVIPPDDEGEEEI